MESLHAPTVTSARARSGAALQAAMQSFSQDAEREHEAVIASYLTEDHKFVLRVSAARGGATNARCFMDSKIYNLEAEVLFPSRDSIKD